MPPNGVALQRPFQMIDAIKIQNFRGFQSLHLKKCSRINVIVGDNGSGKTTLLEAIFLALCGSPDKALLIRQWRGGDPQIVGSVDGFILSAFGELFHDPYDPSQKIAIELAGSGPEVRSLYVARGRAEVSIPKEAKSASESEIRSLLDFVWVDSEKGRHRAAVGVTPNGIVMQNTGEHLPNWHMFAAQTPISSREAATMLSEQRKVRRDRAFVGEFVSVFNHLEDLTVEDHGGVPVIHASVRGANRMLPVHVVSGAVSRAIAFCLAISSRKKGIVLIDEVEDGIFHTKHEPLSKLMIQLARDFDTQLFLTTHSIEWLEAFVRAAGDYVDDICLWRAGGMADGKPIFRRFGGATFKAGIESSGEVR